MKISEIFSTIQGEGKYTGYPTTFIRLYGCNMLCDYCDTMYAVVGKRYSRMSIERIVQEVNRLGNRHICITGGEPLFQEETMPLVYALESSGYVINIETNGGIEIPDNRSNRIFSYTMDIKTPCSGKDNVAKNIYSNLELLSSKDEVKFVIASEEDYNFAKGTLKNYPTHANVIFSPMFIGKKSTIMEDLVDWVMQAKLKNVRIGIQTHKILNVK